MHESISTLVLVQLLMCAQQVRSGVLLLFAGRISTDMLVDMMSVASKLAPCTDSHQRLLQVTPQQANGYSSLTPGGYGESSSTQTGFPRHLNSSEYQVSDLQQQQQQQQQVPPKRHLREGFGPQGTADTQQDPAGPITSFYDTAASVVERNLHQKVTA